MELVRNIVRRVTNKLFKEEKVLEVQQVSRTNAYLNYAYRIVLWEDPRLTWIALGLVHVLFWVVAYLELRLFGLLFIGMLSLLLLDAYFEYRGLEAPCTASTEAVRQIATVLTGTYQYLLNLRRESHSTFCGVMCLNFLVLSVIAKNFNGYLLTYLCILIVFFGPFGISKLPPQYVQKFKNAVRTISTSEGMLAERELIPFLSDKDRNNTELDSLDEKPDSISSSLIVGISSMPSYQEAEGSLDGLDEEDLNLPAQHNRKYIPAPEEEYSSESELEDRIDFDSAHFNKDSSSDDEADYGRGMKFSEEYTKEYVESLKVPSSDRTSHEAKTLQENLMQTMVNVGSALLSNIMVTKMTPKVRKDFSEEESSSTGSQSDFEMIGSDDLNEGS